MSDNKTDENGRRLDKDGQPIDGQAGQVKPDSNGQVASPSVDENGRQLDQDGNPLDGQTGKVVS